MEKNYYKDLVTGIVASINTPFLENGDIDYQGLQNFIDYAIQAGAQALLLTPGDSLYCVLTDQDIADITKFCVKAVNKRVGFIAAANQWWLNKTKEYVRYACDMGADAVILYPPNRGVTAESIVDYYKAASSEGPVFILSAGLSCFGVSKDLEIVRTLYQEVPNVKGFKEDFNARFAQQACLMTHDRWAIFAGGAKQTHMDMMPYGCDGYMSVFITYKPVIAHSYWNAVKNNDLKKAVEVIRDYDLPLFNYIYSEFPAGGDAAQHAMLELAGICGRWRRKPLADLTDEDMEKLKYFLDANNMGAERLL
jgi:4-hydroxy-tetrahydrodipicolinate synthase